MISLLIGFIIPAVVFAIFGLIACLRRSSASHCTNKRSYAIIESSENNKRCDVPLLRSACMKEFSDDALSYQNTYHDFHFVQYLPVLPPSYSESMNLQAVSQKSNQKFPRSCDVPLLRSACMKEFSDDALSYQNTYHDFHFVQYLPVLPPSYSESMNLQAVSQKSNQKFPRRSESCFSYGAATMNVNRSHCLKSKSKHIYPSPRIKSAFNLPKFSYGVSQKVPLACQY
ncbi:hypothetical protein Tcan_05551 [Toxocara canis]|uniref:Uncharacterized protein n=1 Tax=Toxocara canis TaxID=6265 RepID=A0A0B2V0A0_TOXCA|nr:hypothetical protein Tcan_05551 [Toxocara canis]